MDMWEAKKTLTELTVKQQQGILDAERVISRLQAECQTLSHIFLDAQHDRLQMEKEHQVLANNHQVLRDELRHKFKTIEGMRSQISIEQNFMLKCASQFQDKTGEIHVMIGELTNLDAKTRELEAKRETMLTLEYHMHRLVSEHMFEKQKCMALIHEFSVLRNVHRWHAISAVDQTYAKQLNYRGQLSAKIDKAHRELIELKAEKNRLRELLKAKGEKVVSLSANEVMERMAAYSEDLQEKEVQLSELKRAVAENNPAMRNSIASVNQVQEKIVQRRGTVARMRTKSVAGLLPKHEPWFLTEAPVNKYIGGGFIARPTITVADPPANEPITPSPLVERRSKSAFSSPMGKKQQKHGPGSSLLSPQRKPLPALL
jgi:chromosome segregation ATPase